MDQQMFENRGTIESLIDAVNELANAPSIGDRHRNGTPWQGNVGEGGQSTTNDRADAPHRCHICQRTYERSDHLRRHQNSHENRRPFRCSTCSKSFNRVDLLNRHVAAHARTARDGGRAIQRKERVGRACVACAAAKVKCGDQKPCERCEKKGISCDPTPNTSRADSRVFITPPRESYDSSRDSMDLVNTNLQRRMTGEGSDRIDGDDTASSSHTLNPSVGMAESSNRSEISNSIVISDAIYPTLSPIYQPPILDNMDSLPVDMNGVFDAIMDDLFILPPANFNNQSLDFGFQDFNFQSDEYMASFEPLRQVAFEVMASPDVPNKVATSERDVSRGYAAYKRSPWLWTPAKKDGLLDSQQNLEINEDNIPLVQSVSPRSDSASTGYIPLIDFNLRDKMFYLISTMSKYARGVPSFPSKEMLNHIVEAFFIRHSYQIDIWIHVPTLSTTNILPEFMIALVAAGSTVISVPAIWKMGLVLLDVVRITVSDLWEKENTNTRELQPLQAFMLFLDTGLWSGFQKQMELSESFTQPIITMMRRGGILAAPTDSRGLIPYDSDTGQVLDAKWKKWVKRESFKRLSIHLFFHEVRASIALQKNALLSLTELSFSAPASRALFLAGSAAEWKTKYMEHPPSRPVPRLIDILRDLDLLEQFQENIDTGVCFTVVLYGFWSQVWTFRESCKFHGMNEGLDSPHRLWLTTQQRELYREIRELREKLLAVTEPQAELVLITELFLMSLYVSPEELQRFAGKNGEDAASQVLTSLSQWCITEDARKAVWHAGQILFRASSMPPADLRDFYTVAVYFASLTLWAYGHLSNAALGDHSKRSKACSTSLDSHTTPSIVVLNASESREISAFISRGHGTPGLIIDSPQSFPENQNGGNTTSVKLRDPNNVLKMARSILRRNSLFCPGPLPPLVENIGNLMRDLSSLPESRFSRCPSPVES